MSSPHSKCGSALCAAFAFFLTTQTMAAQQGGAVTGTVSDPLGGRVASASVTLVRDGQPAGQATTDEAGEFTIPGVAEGRYQGKAEAGGVEPPPPEPNFLAGFRPSTIDVGLSGGPPPGAGGRTAGGPPPP